MSETPIYPTAEQLIERHAMIEDLLAAGVISTEAAEGLRTKANELPERWLESWRSAKAAPRFPRPLRNRVLVKELPPEDTSPSGLIHIPDQVKGQHEQNWRAIVLAVGPGKAQIKLLERAAKLLERYERYACGVPTTEIREAADVAGDLWAGIARGFGSDVQPGDIVVVSKYVHTEVRVGEETCRIIAATDILAVLEPTEASELRRWAQALLGRLAAPWNGDTAPEPSTRATRLEELTAE